MGRVNTRVGLGSVELAWVQIIYFRWVRLGRRSEMAKAQKFKKNTFGEFIDTDGHGFD